MKTLNLITRKEYMSNPGELHHKYYLQFATLLTERFVLRSLTIKDIESALLNGDKHLNGIKIPFNNMGNGGSWWWDEAPINMGLLKKLGECNSPSIHTCVAKAIARELTFKYKL